MSFRRIQVKNIGSSITSIEDPLIILGSANTAETDIGFLGKIGVDTYTGLIRDADDSKFYLVDDYTSAQEPGNDINTNAIGDLGSLVVASVEINNSIVLPKGSTSARPANPSEGQMWFNTDTKDFEGYNGTTWVTLIPAITESATAADEVILTTEVTTMATLLPNTFTVSVNGSLPNDIVLTPVVATGPSGTFNPTSVTLTNAQDTATFTFTPSTDGDYDFGVNVSGASLTVVDNVETISSTS